VHLKARRRRIPGIRGDAPINVTAEVCLPIRAGFDWETAWNADAITAATIITTDSGIGDGDDDDDACRDDDRPRPSGSGLIDHPTWLA